MGKLVVPEDGEGGDVLALPEPLGIVHSSETHHLATVDLATDEWTLLGDRASPFMSLRSYFDRTNGILAFCVCDEDLVRVLDPRSGCRLSFALPHDCIGIEAIHGGRIAFTWQHGLRIYDIGTGLREALTAAGSTTAVGELDPVCSLETDAGRVVGWAGGTLLVARDDGAIGFWDTQLTSLEEASYDQLWLDVPHFDGSLAGHTLAVTDCDVATDQLHVLTGSEDNTARIWHLPSSTCLHTLAHEEAVQRVRFASDDIVYTQTVRCLRAWNARSGRRIAELPLYGPVRDLQPVGPDRLLLVQEGPLAKGQGVRLLRLAPG